MTLENRKSDLIELIENLEDEKLLQKIENILYQSKSKSLNLQNQLTEKDIQKTNEPNSEYESINIIEKEDLDKFLEAQIVSGKYKNKQEVIRAGLKLLIDKEYQILKLNKAIEEGNASSIESNFDPIENLMDLKAKKRNG